MALHALTSAEGPRSRGNRPRRPITQLGWPHYWLLAATLGGMLALVALVFLIATQT
jgi:hypothetical protein